MVKVFLGGTVNKSTWRDKLIPQLKVDYYNPVVPNWDDTAYQREIQERMDCDFCLYVITPKIEGYYSIAEVVDDSNKQPEKTIYCIIEDDDGKKFTPHQLKSVKRVGELVERNGGKYFHDMGQVASFLNIQKKRKPKRMVEEE